MGSLNAESKEPDQGDSTTLLSATQDNYQHLKLVKRGYRGLMAPQVCGVSFETYPAWIWAFRLSDWSQIYITDVDELQLRQYHRSTWEFLEDRMAIIATHQIPATVGIVGSWFVSGSKNFLDQFACHRDTPVVCWLEGCGRRKPGNTESRSWFSVSHETVGGSTTARGVFGRDGLNGLVIPHEVIRRSISHILKYSLRPEPCSVPVTDAHYLVSHRLSTHQIDKPVVYETGFSRSGWGRRQLAASELAQAFDLPAYVDWNPGFATSIIPIQVFRVVVDAVLNRIRPDEQESSRIRRRITASTHVIEANPLTIDAVWLKSLQKWLPGSWANVDISDRAVKADDAEVVQFPWNQRISLVLPSTTPLAIRGMENLGLRRWRTNLRASFFTYLQREYGPHWRIAYKRGMVSRVGKRTKGGIKPPPSKKQRFMEGCEGLNTHNEGGAGPMNEAGPRRERRMEVGNEAEMVDEANPHPKRERRKRQSDDSQLVQDVSCGMRILRQVLQSAWWDWNHGSSLFFWRWNGREQVRAARDGLPIFVTNPLPTKRHQKAARLEPSQMALVRLKLEGMVQRDYLETGHVASTVHYFAVPKGDTDIRVVFDGTSSGLNESLWAPNFFLPSAKSAALCMSFTTWMADMDFGEMFHNFHMDPKIRAYSGVDVGSMTTTRSEGHISRSPIKPASLLRWTRLFMGMRPSPYNAVRHYYWGEEFAKGNPARETNPMGYDCVKLNLPGMSNYDPAYPKVMKWRLPPMESERGMVAGDVVTFVDDVRISGYSKSNCWDVYRQFASRIQFLGMQNAPRKFRPPSQRHAGAWTGTIFRIGTDRITKSVAQEKWDKGRRMVATLLRTVKGDKEFRPLLDRRELEKETGFLNHLSMTFETMVPFLKGFYLTLNSWREGRDEDDWKVTPKRWKAILFARAANNSEQTTVQKQGQTVV